MPKRITATMLADLARQKAGCIRGGIGAQGHDYYAFVRLDPPTPPRPTFDYTGDHELEPVRFYYKHYGKAAKAKQAAWNFLMERPDKEGEA